MPCRGSSNASTGTQSRTLLVVLAAGWVLADKTTDQRWASVWKALSVSAPLPDIAAALVIIDLEVTAELTSWADGRWLSSDLDDIGNTRIDIPRILELLGGDR